MNKIEDYIEVNKKALSQTARTGVNLLLFAGIILVYLVGYNLITGLLLGLRLGMLSGLGLYFVQVLLIGHFLSVLYSVIVYNRINRKTLTGEFTQYLNAVIRVFFILYLVGLVYSYTIAPLLLLPIQLGVIAVWYLVLSPLPYAMIFEGRESVDAILYSLQFIKDNFLYWIPINLVFVAIYFGVLVNLPFLALIGNGLTTVATAAVGAVYFVFAAHLFKQLANSNPRKRAFQRGFRS